MCSSQARNRHEFCSRLKNLIQLKAQQVKNLPAVQETQKMWVRSLGWKDALEEKMAIYSSILVWRIPWTEEPGRLESME